MSEKPQNLNCPIVPLQGRGTMGQLSSVTNWHETTHGTGVGQ